MRTWLEQLTAQGFLRVEPGPYPTLSLTEKGRSLLKGEGAAHLLEIKGEERVVKKSRARSNAAKLSGSDGELFESLRDLRRELAAERGIPPYLICNDRTLTELASKRPMDRAGLLAIPGIGEKKAADLGPIFLKAIAEA